MNRDTETDGAQMASAETGRNHALNECEEIVAEHGLKTVERCENCRRELFSRRHSDSGGEQA